MADHINIRQRERYACESNYQDARRIAHAEADLQLMRTRAESAERDLDAIFTRLLRGDPVELWLDGDGRRCMVIRAWEPAGKWHPDDVPAFEPTFTAAEVDKARADVLTELAEWCDTKREKAQADKAPVIPPAPWESDEIKVPVDPDHAHMHASEVGEASMTIGHRAGRVNAWRDAANALRARAASINAAIERAEAE